ncbi:hypothetical protein KDA_24590 [Dictyobacter alpinus]|uniref:AAA+ ATPase domain-containing protein n=2 Tax=Dictyobacter alpinus TaxID=2014873 RepID=A0A402B6K3_9CHLR|nr:hypothetical protein KDA_24590 [Dictyobacter alpinus]
MERLNEIFDRTGRRHPLSEQRAHTRTPQSQGSANRRFVADPQSRPAQKYQPGASSPSYPQSPYPSSRAPRHYSQFQQEAGHTEGRSYSEPVSRTDHATYPSSYPRRTGVDNGSPYPVPSQPHHDQQHIQPLQPRPTSDYHSLHTSDAYAPSSRADVVENWDDNGMGYGDWEKDGGDYIYEDEEEEVYEEVPINTYQPPTYRSRPNADLEPPSRGTRNNLHDTRLASAIANQQARSQELPSYQRITQPLHPHAVQDIGRERERGPITRPGQTSSSRYLRPVRQEIVPPGPQEMMPSPPIMDKGVCPRCRGAGYLRADVPFGHPNFGKPIACECKESERKEKRRQQLRDMSNMDAFRNQSFRSFSMHTPGVEEAYKAATAFAQNPSGWLVLVGPNGCGKTHLAAAIANLSLDSGAVVLFEAVPDLLDHLRAAFAPTATEIYDQLFSKMREAELLVLDDLGAQQSSPWANEKLFQLLNYRYNLAMPTVITANLKGLQAVDERIRSRLNDRSLVNHISMDRARDFRPQNVRKR